MIILDSKMEPVLTPASYGEGFDFLARLIVDASMLNIFEGICPNREVAELLILSEVLSPEEMKEEFVGCVLLVPATGLGFLDWLAERCGYLDPALFISEGSSYEFLELCAKKRFEVAKWLFAKYSFAANCSEHAIASYLSCLNEDPCSRSLAMADWINQQVKSNRNMSG